VNFDAGEVAWWRREVQEVEHGLRRVLWLSGNGDVYYDERIVEYERRLLRARRTYWVVRARPLPVPAAPPLRCGLRRREHRARRRERGTRRCRSPGRSRRRRRPELAPAGAAA
jgi:hypothetical protein